MTTDKARDLAEQIESSVTALATETDEVRKSDLFKQWLNAMATFSSYSFVNAHIFRERQHVICE